MSIASDSKFDKNFQNIIHILLNAYKIQGIFTDMMLGNRNNMEEYHLFCLKYIKWCPAMGKIYKCGQ